jgi:hypothetical protein
VDGEDRELVVHFDGFVRFGSGLEVEGEEDEDVEEDKR